MTLIFIYHTNSSSSILIASVRKNKNASTWSGSLVEILPLTESRSIERCFLLRDYSHLSLSVVGMVKELA